MPKLSRNATVVAGGVVGGKAPPPTNRAGQLSLSTGVSAQLKETINQQVAPPSSKRQIKMMNAPFRGQKLYFQTSAAEHLPGPSGNCRINRFTLEPGSPRIYNLACRIQTRVGRGLQPFALRYVQLSIYLK